jgi:hypothetical protein
MQCGQSVQLLDVKRVDASLKPAGFKRVNIKNLRLCHAELAQGCVLCLALEAFSSN